jgi:aspartyl-tRNA(Asn)/glutamyl-tRNA(Gln) amidotransferase subunit A
VSIATPYSLTASGIVHGLRDGSIRLDDLVHSYVDRTKALAPRLNSHVFFSESAIEAQLSLLKKRPDREKLPLYGVPVLVKDNICTRDMPTTCGSRILAGYVPQYDATVIARLRNAGALIFGKANQDEFAMGSSNENSSYGPVKNPWDEERVPGGSSGGSAAAVAADLVPVALGSDTGGSIRQPASLCGVVGLKPTYGAVSRYGLVAYGSSLDVIGPLCRSVTDAAMVFDVISGHDPRDATSVSGDFEPISPKICDLDLSKTRIGVITELSGAGNDDDTLASFRAAMKSFKELGATVEEVSLPEISYAIAMYYLIATAEASSNLARFDGVRFGHRAAGKGEQQSLKDMYINSRSEGFGREVKQRIMLGTFALSSGYYDAYYGKALAARERLRAAMSGLFARYDVLASPTSPTPAFRLGEKASDPLAMYLSDVGTIGANLAGLPAISVPCGMSGGRLPIGLQLMASWQNEALLLGVSHKFEQLQRWSERYKPDV